MSLMQSLTGLLEAPATELAAVNASYLSFSWTPPFSLDIPDSNPDILFYSFSETLSPSTGNISEPQSLVFPVLATPVEFSVTAWNIVGEGATASATHQPCSISLGETFWEYLCCGQLLTHSSTLI